MKKNTTRNLTVAAMLSAVAFILMFIEFPLPMLIPSFVKMDFSDLPALLGAFALGPVYGVIISFMKNLLHVVIKGTSTALVGELCNFMLGAVFSALAGYLPGLRQVLPHAAGSHPGHVSGHPALCQQPDQVPDHLQYALYSGQGPAGCPDLHVDL